MSLVALTHPTVVLSTRSLCQRTCARAGALGVCTVGVRILLSMLSLSMSLPSCSHLLSPVRRHSLIFAAHQAVRCVEKFVRL